jgi:hypothetical protein
MGSSGDDNVFFRRVSSNWKFYVNGIVVSGTLTAPISGHPYDFVRTANTWQLWDGGSPLLGYSDRNLMYETAPGVVGFLPREQLLPVQKVLVAPSLSVTKRALHRRFAAISRQPHRNNRIRIAYTRHCTKEKGLATNRRKSLLSKVAEAGIEPARPVKGTGF